MTLLNRLNLQSPLSLHLLTLRLRQRQRHHQLRRLHLRSRLLFLLRNHQRVMPLRQQVKTSKL